MITTPITSTTNTVQGSNFKLKTEDFINMMLTELKNQDPMKPASNEELLQQMSQIGQLQASTSLQDSLKSMVLQNQIGSAGNLIGKMVAGMDDQSKQVSGLVNSVRVESDGVYLELDTGKKLSLGRVTSIAGAPANTAPSASAPLK